MPLDMHSVQRGNASFPPALQVLLRKMAFDLNNLRSDVKTMAEKLDARNQQKRGDKTETDGTPRFHGIKIKSYCRRSLLVSMNLLLRMTAATSTTLQPRNLPTLLHGPKPRRGRMKANMSEM